VWSSVTYTSVAIAADMTTVISTTTSSSTLGTSVVPPGTATSGQPEVSYVLSGLLPPTAVIPADDASGVVADLLLESVTDSIMADLAPLKFRALYQKMRRPGFANSITIASIAITMPTRRSNCLRCR